MKKTFNPKRCIICRKQFIPNSNVQKVCGKKCQKERDRMWKKRYDKKHFKELKEKRKRYYQKHREELRKKCREYYQKNKQKYKEYYKAYKKKNRVKLLLRSRKYERENKEKRRQDYQKNIEENREKGRKTQKEYYQKNKNNPKFIEKRKEYAKKWRKKNPEKIKGYNTKYYQKKQNKISLNLRNAFNRALKLYTKTGKIMSSKQYGIDYKAIIEYLKPFPKDLKNYEIHHIKPLHTFNFVNKDSSTNLKEVGKAFLPENHKWVTIEEHKKIHRRLNKNETLQI